MTMGGMGFIPERLLMMMMIYRVYILMRPPILLILLLCLQPVTDIHLGVFPSEGLPKGGFTNLQD